MTTTTATKLTRAEAAYAHLASFKRGDAVDVIKKPGSYWDEACLIGIVERAQADGDGIERAFLIVEGPELHRRISVRDLLSGEWSITTREGSAPRFDTATWAMQNGQG
jgi:hypothetical protein